MLKISKLKKIGMATFALAMLMTGCSKNTTGDSTGPGGSSGGGGVISKMNGQSYIVLQEKSLERQESLLKGTGALVFEKPLVNEDYNYAIDFSLEQNGSVTLAAGATNKLEKGVELTFSNTSENDLLKVELRVREEHYDITEDFEGLSSNGKISMEIDIHGHGHIVIWVNGGEEIEFTFINEMLDNFWGLSLTDATVTKATVGPPKDVH